MSTRLKRNLGMLFATAVFLVAALAMLPGESEAQDTGRASTNEAQQNNTNTTSETADAPASSPRPEGEAPTSLVVDPGDSLWSIGQERLGAGATPGRIAEEVERLFALNRGRLGNDPNLLFAGQELWLAAPSAEAPATPQPAATEPVAQEPVAQEPVAAPSGGEPAMVDLQTVPGTTAAAPAVVPEEPSSSVVEPTATAPEEQPAEGRPAAAGSDAEQEAGEPSTLPDASPASLESDDAQARRLLGFGILALTLLLAIVAAWRLPMRRDVEDAGVWGTPVTFADLNGFPNGANGRGKAWEPAVHTSVEPTPNPANLLGHPFTRRPYVDRTAMIVSAGVKRRGAPLRRQLARRPRPGGASLRQGRAEERSTQGSARGAQNAHHERSLAAAPRVLLERRRGPRDLSLSSSKEETS